MDLQDFVHAAERILRIGITIIGRDLVALWSARVWWDVPRNPRAQHGHLPQKCGDAVVAGLSSQAVDLRDLRPTKTAGAVCTRTRSKRSICRAIRS